MAKVNTVYISDPLKYWLNERSMPRPRVLRLCIKEDQILR